MKQIKIIDPVNDEQQWCVVFTASGQHVYLIQTLRGTSRHVASQRGIVGYRFIERPPQMREVDIARQILWRQPFWSWDNGTTLQLADYQVRTSPILFVQVVPSFESTKISTIRIKNPAYFYAVSARKKERIDLCTSAVTRIYAGKPV